MSRDLSTDNHSETIQAASLMGFIAGFAPPVGILLLLLNVAVPRDGLAALGLGLVIWGIPSALTAVLRNSNS